jgi:hypothetical protein
MFLRFAITHIDEDSHKPKGVFVAAYALLESGDLAPDEWKRLRGLLDWFNENLPHPSGFNACRAIFWFKSSAYGSISRIWELVDLLRAHGYHIKVYKCRRLGNITYEDEMQVAAYPSDRDGRITVQ